MSLFIQQIVNGLIVGGTYALVTIGLTMIFGLMRVLNYAHGEFYMLGGIISYTVIVSLNIGFFISLPITVVLCLIIGLIIERTLVRHLYNAPIITTAIATTGFSIFIQNFIFLFWGNMPKTIESPFPVYPIEIYGITLAPVRLFVLLVSVVVIAVTQLIIKYTKLGVSMRATFQDRDVASMYGIRTRQIYSLTFAYGSALAGLAGLLCGSFLTISPFMGTTMTDKAWAIAIVGGTGNIPGAILGGFFIGVVEALGAGYISAAYKDSISFIIVILVMIFCPNGLFTRRKSAI